MGLGWDNIFIEYSGDKKRKFKRDFAIIKSLGITEERYDTPILELFCGKGECQELLQKMGFVKAYGLDISKTLLDWANKDSKILVCDSLNICCKPDKFDLVFINEGLHHLRGMPQIELSFSEVKRVLKNDGIFAFYEPANTLARSIAQTMVLSPLSCVSRRTRLLKSILMEEMQEYRFWLTHIPEVLQLMRDTGFSIEKQYKTPIHMGIIARVRKA
jgi:ubiquinone/menaquinone biosynthesis C-methylase UbiE